MRDLSFLKNPSLSASSIPTNPTSGMSSPSLNRFIPTNTSNSPSRSCLIISVRSSVLTSECRYLVLIPCSAKYSVNSSANFFVSVVSRTLLFFWIAFWIWFFTSSIWFFIGFISTVGSISPVGRIICSTTLLLFIISYSDGVAETKIVLNLFSIIFSNSSNFRGRLS